MTEPAVLTEIRMRAQEPIPRYRRRQVHHDRDWLLGYIDGLLLDGRQQRDHHALLHPDCTQGAA